MPKYFDVHSHLQDPQFDADREEAITRLRENDTHTIVVGTDLNFSERAVELADKHQEIYASIGIHPVDNQSAVFEKARFEKLVTHPKVVAIGECGLDFFHAKKAQDYERQKKLFETQIDFALAHNKPLMIHARNAYDELLKILEPLKTRHREKLRGNVHFFSGSPEVADRLFKIGFTVSFTGVITFARDYDEVIRRASLDKILVETDSPYVAPAPFRGKRNEPVYVSEVVKKIAEIRNDDFETIRGALASNALSMII